MVNTAHLTQDCSVAGQIGEQDIAALAALGFRSIVNNRPDGEADGQPSGAAIAAAARQAGLDYRHIPVVGGRIAESDIAAFRAALAEMPAPVLAYCRSGTRSAAMWALSQACDLGVDAVLQATGAAGYDLAALRPRLEAEAKPAAASGPASAAADEMGFQIVIVGGGAAGIATASSLLRRRPDLSIAIVEPAEQHFYQPGWTMVGGGIFRPGRTVRPMARVMPRKVRWLRGAAAGFEPERNRIVLEDGRKVGYEILIVCPGLKLNWAGIEGLTDTLGRNGVTSNYRFDLAPYTWRLVQGLRSGRAVFTQPLMPIKCAGAPQKAVYLSCDHWRRAGVLGHLDVAFHAATPVLFGVKEFVPPLMRYIARYGVDLNLNSTLTAVDGPARKAWFTVKRDDGAADTVETTFDMLHVCPPQTAPDFVRASPLADAAGWVEVDPETLVHRRFANIFALGDVCSTPNAKTAAAVRKQAPIVAENVLATIGGRAPDAIYNGYGSCPLTVERGRIVLAEFGYGGALLPTFSFNPATEPTRLAWMLKRHLLPSIYFELMLKGREWLAAPPHRPAPPVVQTTALSPGAGPDDAQSGTRKSA